MDENTSSTTRAFTKMNGLGNEFIIIDARTEPLALSGDQVRALADPAHEITKGCDQVLIIHPPRPNEIGAAFMQIFNADGGEVEACGNGARAVAAYLAQTDQTNTTHLQSLGGTLACQTQLQDNHAHVRIEMPAPQLDTPIELHSDLPPAFRVNIGNPHAVIFVDGETKKYAEDFGSNLTHHAAFPDGANINFATVTDLNTLRLDTFERGAGLTLACGTGACAAAVASVESGLCQAGTVTIRPPFNTDDNDADVLHITYQTDKSLFMAGPVDFEFTGEVAL